METQNVTETLKNEFIARCQRNESYSLRAYAKYLNVDHSLLTKIFRGQRALSPKMAFQVGEKIGLTSTKIRELIDTTAQKNLSKQIQEDVFIILSLSLIEILHVSSSVHIAS